MAQAEVRIAESSYHRCGENPAFYATLYEALLASDPRIPPMFACTEFPRQHKLLKHALGLLIIYAKRPNPALLRRIALRHDRPRCGTSCRCSWPKSGGWPCCARWTR
jgi:hypothetical protein